MQATPIPRHRLTTLATIGALLAAAACGRSQRVSGPPAELLVSTADSTFWVTSDTAGVRMRGAPILLARVDGAFREVYVADEDRSFLDAVFVGQRLFSRDLIKGDSVELLRDSIVPRMAREYAAAHPEEKPLSPDEDANDKPTTTATAEIEVLAVHGPYLSYEYHTDVDIGGERRHVNAHRVRRGVVDLRTGRPASAASLFGDSAADEAIGEALQEWRRTRDSLLSLSDDRLRGAQRAMSAYAFDAKSFTVDDENREPRLVFAVPGEGKGGDVAAIDLSPRRVPAPTWWTDVTDQLPLGTDGDHRWVRGPLALFARTPGEGAVTRLTLGDSARRELSVGSVATAPGRVVWLDATVTSGMRRALRKAFSEAAGYDDERRITALPRRRTTAGAVVIPVMRRPSRPRRPSHTSS